MQKIKSIIDLFAKICRIWYSKIRLFKLLYGGNNSEVYSWKMERVIDMYMYDDISNVTYSCRGRRRRGL